MLFDENLRIALEQHIAALNRNFTPTQLEQFRDLQLIPLLANGLFEPVKTWLENLLNDKPDLIVINGLFAMIYYEIKFWQTSQAYAVLSANTLPQKEFWRALQQAAILKEVVEPEPEC